MSSTTSKDNEADSRTRAESPSPKLNLFALPSLTTLLFALIASVILIAIAAGLRQNPSALGLMIAAGMVILPLRSFLRQVEKKLCSLDLSRSKAETDVSSLTQGVEEAAQLLGLDCPPQLLLTPRPTSPQTIGSWRRRYLVLGCSQADRLAEMPEPVQRALWLHEVAHFANGDHWKVGLSRSLLYTSVVFMTWSAVFLLGIVILALVYGLELFEPGYLDTLPLDPAVRGVLAPLWPDPSVMAPLLEKARAIQPGLAALYVVNAHLPFILSGVVLLLFVWRRLVQVREFYADARVAAQIGEAEQARQTLVQATTATASWSTSVPGRFRIRAENLGQWFDRVMPFHPSWSARFACLKDPSRVYGSWVWAGLTAGLVVLLLDLILVGPFTLGFISAGPAHFATLTGFIILALWLLPGLCQGFASTGHMARQVVGATLLFVGLRAGWLLINTALILTLLGLDPEMLRTVFNATVLLSGKVLTDSSALPLPEDPVALALWALGGGWGFTLLVLLCLLASLMLTGLLLRRLLTWYAFPHGERRLLRVGWSMILVLTFVVGWAVLPPLTALIQGDLTSLLQPVPLISLGAALLIAMAWGGWFVSRDRRFSRRCPSCGKKIPGWFKLGKRCPACGQTLHSWLQANY